jgi:transposase
MAAPSRACLDEAAAALFVSPSTARRLIKHGQLAASQLCKGRIRSSERPILNVLTSNPAGARLLAPASIYDGATRSEAAKIGGVGLRIIRDWVMRFNARGPDGLLDGEPPGQSSKLNDVSRQPVAPMIESGPTPAAHGEVRWRLFDLAQWIFEEFRISIAKQTLSRELRARGYRKLSARPRHHAQAAGAIWILKKPRAWMKLRAGSQSMSRP